MKTKLNINLDEEFVHTLAKWSISMMGLSLITKIMAFFFVAIEPLYEVVRNITFITSVFPMCVLGFIFVYYMLGGITINNKNFNG